MPQLFGLVQSRLHISEAACFLVALFVPGFDHFIMWIVFSELPQSPTGHLNVSPIPTISFICLLFCSLLFFSWPSYLGSPGPRSLDCLFFGLPICCTWPDPAIYDHSWPSDQYECSLSVLWECTEWFGGPPTPSWIWKWHILHFNTSIRCNEYSESFVWHRAGGETQCTWSAIWPCLLNSSDGRLEEQNRKMMIGW